LDALDEAEDRNRNAADRHDRGTGIEETCSMSAAASTISSGLIGGGAWEIDA
jgi:hypothetical protein